MDNDISKNELIAACFILFGPLYHFSHENLVKTDLDELKNSFRSKAKLFHPDKAKIHGKSEIDMTNRFKELNNAYSLLIKYLAVYSKNKQPLNSIYNFNFKKNYDDFTYKKYQNSDKSFQNQKKTYYKNDFFYTGNVPNRNLRFGEYLFYSKIISWNLLINAIVAQYQKRPKFGDICIDLNYLEQKDIMNIIKNIKKFEKFGETALRLNLLSNFQMFAVLGMQKKYNMPIGKFFIDNNIMNHENVNECAMKQTEHNFKVKFHTKFAN